MKITTTQPVNHDGKDVEVGSELDLSKAQAEALIAVGSAEPSTLTRSRRSAAVTKSSADDEAAAAAAQLREAELAAKRNELQEHIAALEAAVGEPETDEAKALIQQQLDEAKAELQALE